MNLTTDRSQGVSIVRVNETRLLYPLLSEFATTISSLIGSGEYRLLLDLSSVTYVDSATIGCLMDLYRQAAAAGGSLKLAGVQKRVESMLTMTGAQDVLEIHADEPSAIKSFVGLTRVRQFTADAALFMDTAAAGTTDGFVGASTSVHASTSSSTRAANSVCRACPPRWATRCPMIG